MQLIRHADGTYTISNISRLDLAKIQLGLISTGETELHAENVPAWMTGH